jgi:hypothetical protein
MRFAEAYNESMKTLLILFLVVVLAGVAAFTRPSERSFKYYYRHNQVQPIGELVGQVTGTATADNFVKSTQYKNFVLWANIEKDGTVLYTGVFSHWFKR